MKTADIVSGLWGLHSVPGISSCMLYTDLVHTGHSIVGSLWSRDLLGCPELSEDHLGTHCLNFATILFLLSILVILWIPILTHLYRALQNSTEQ
jgi:hypothetical protein